MYICKVNLLVCLVIMNAEHQYISELRTALARLVKKLRKKTVSGQHLSLTERSTMVQLQNGAMLPSELAANEHITNQSMSQIVAHLLELGYINRTPSETDGRKVLISLTAAGAAVLAQVRSERDEWLLKAIKETCTAEEQEIIKRVVIPLTKIIDFD
jgi:DNA-binding MarR family transcriptional regulator